MDTDRWTDEHYDNSATIRSNECIRPPDIHVGGLIFYWDSSFFFSPRTPELTERNSTKIDHMVGSEYTI